MVGCLISFLQQGYIKCAVAAPDCQCSLLYQYEELHVSMSGWSLSADIYRLCYTRCVHGTADRFVGSRLCQ